MKNKSQKGVKGTVGAPAKPVRIPAGSFTMKRAIKFNEGRCCALTVQKFITAAIKGFRWTGTGKDKAKVKVEKTLQYGAPIPQPKGGVGRPAYRIEPLGTVSKAPTPKPAKVKKAKAKTAPTVTATVVNVTADVPVTPEVPQTPTVTTPAPEPVVETPAAVVTPTNLP